MDGDGELREAPGSGLRDWYAQRSRSWARHYRLEMLQAWVLGQLCAVCFVAMAGLMPRLSAAGNSIGSSGMIMQTVLMSGMAILGMLFLFGLQIKYFILAISRIGWCRPGSELLGSQSDAEFMRGVQQGSFLLAIRMALLFFLPLGLVIIFSRSSQFLGVHHFDLASLLLSLLEDLLRLLAWALIVATVALQLPRLGLGLQVGLSLVLTWLQSGLGALLAIAVLGISDAAAPASMAGLLQSQSLLHSAASLTLIVLALLISRRRPAEFIEDYSSAVEADR